MAMNPDYNHPTEIIGQIQNLHLVFFLCTICGTIISKGTENVTLGFHTSTVVVLYKITWYLWHLKDFDRTFERP